TWRPDARLCATSRLPRTCRRRDWRAAELVEAAIVVVGRWAFKRRLVIAATILRRPTIGRHWRTRATTRPAGWSRCAVARATAIDALAWARGPGAWPSRRVLIHLAAIAAPGSRFWPAHAAHGRAQEVRQCGGQLVAIAIARGWVLREALQDDALQRRRDLRIERAG